MANVMDIAMDGGVEYELIGGGEVDMDAYDGLEVLLFGAEEVTEVEDEADLESLFGQENGDADVKMDDGADIESLFGEHDSENDGEKDSEEGSGEGSEEDSGEDSEEDDDVDDDEDGEEDGEEDGDINAEMSDESEADDNDSLPEPVENSSPCLCSAPSEADNIQEIAPADKSSSPSKSGLCLPPTASEVAEMEERARIDMSNSPSGGSSVSANASSPSSASLPSGSGESHDPMVIDDSDEESATIKQMEEEANARKQAREELLSLGEDYAFSPALEYAGSLGMAARFGLQPTPRGQCMEGPRLPKRRAHRPKTVSASHPPAARPDPAQDSPPAAAQQAPSLAAISPDPFDGPSQVHEWDSSAPSSLRGPLPSSMAFRGQPGSQDLASTHPEQVANSLPALFSDQQSDLSSSQQPDRSSGSTSPVQVQTPPALPEATLVRPEDLPVLEQLRQVPGLRQTVMVIGGVTIFSAFDGHWYRCDDGARFEGLNEGRGRRMAEGRQRMRW